MTTSSAGDAARVAPWSPLARIGFRFAVLAGALVIYPFPISAIPKMEWLTGGLMRPWFWAISWFAQRVLGLPDPSGEPNGSGDTTWDYVQLLLVVLVAALGAIAWSMLDRRRRAYPRLAAGARVVLRYYLAWMMLSYGIAKVLKVQFPDLPPGWLHQRVGDASPMRLLWDFMGYSTPYSVLAGLAEAVGGALLVWRRTALLGALVIIAVMTNVVMLNLCYDVPVKRLSTQLLIIAVVIALPGLRRLAAALAGRAVAEVAPRLRMSPRRERARAIIKLAMIGTIAVGIYVQFSRMRNRNAHVHELYGAWAVDSFTADGVERPPLTSDPIRWQTWTANAYYTSIWLMDDRRDGETPDNSGSYEIKVDADARTITLTTDDRDRRRETWRYTRPAPDRLVIDGVHGGRYLHVALHREPDGLLVTRGFHWINEVPFNR